jgi:hypothetical protein
MNPPLILTHDPADDWAMVELHRWQYGALPAPDDLRPLDVAQGLDKMAQALENACKGYAPLDELPSPFNVASVMRYAAKLLTHGANANEGTRERADVLEKMASAITEGTRDGARIEARDAMPRPPAVCFALTDAARELRGMRAPNVSSAPQTGRNEPCPCGSGRKFKKCCLIKAALLLAALLVLTLSACALTPRAKQRAEIERELARMTHAERVQAYRSTVSLAYAAYVLRLLVDDGPPLTERQFLDLLGARHPNDFAP